MKKGQIVHWQLDARVPGRLGTGTVITDEEDSHVLVAVDNFAGEAGLGYHPVIRCATTWLLVEKPVAGDGGRPKE